MKLGELKLIAPAFDNGPPRWELTAQPHVMMRLKRILPKVEIKRSGAILLSDNPEICHELEWILDRWPLEMGEGDRKVLRKSARQYVPSPGGHPEAARRRTGPRRLARAGGPCGRVPAAGGRPSADQRGAAARRRPRDGQDLLRAADAPRPEGVAGADRRTDPSHEAVARGTRSPAPHIIRTTLVYDPAEKREMKGHQPDVLITTYAKLWGWSDHLAGQVSTVIFDECQELRVEKARKTIAAGQIADAANYRMGLSATPVFNYGGEIYNILDVLAPGELGSKQEFAREWGIASGEVDVSGGTRSVKAKALGQYLCSTGLMLRRTWKDVDRERPDEPVKIPHPIDADFEIVEEAKSNARELARLILRGGGSQQEIFEAERNLENKIRKATGVAKAPYVADYVRLLLESEDKVVVFAWHRAVYSILLERLDEFNPVLYTGSESAAGKRRAKQDFVEGDARILLISLRSGAGLNGLQLASHIAVFAELDWSPAQQDQCVGRLARPGQEHQVLAYYLVSEAGCDPAMAELLSTKRMQSEPIRDPDAELFEAAPDGSDRMRRLAESVLEDAPVDEDEDDLDEPPLEEAA